MQTREKGSRIQQLENQALEIKGEQARLKEERDRLLEREARFECDKVRSEAHLSDATKTIQRLRTERDQLAHANQVHTPLDFFNIVNIEKMWI